MEQENGKKGLGTLEGVFTPTILTILGVVMYLRLGWVVGNVGLIETVIIILLAHSITNHGFIFIVMRDAIGLICDIK